MNSTLSDAATTPPTILVSTAIPESNSPAKKMENSAPSVQATQKTAPSVPATANNKAAVPTSVASPSTTVGNTTKEIKNRLVPLNGSVEIKVDEKGAFSFYVSVVITEIRNYYVKKMFIFMSFITFLEHSKYFVNLTEKD